jgi:hypothetical protein
MKFIEVGPLPRCGHPYEFQAAVNTKKVVAENDAGVVCRINAFLDHVVVDDTIVCGNLEAYSCAFPVLCRICAICVRMLCSAFDLQGRHEEHIEVKKPFQAQGRSALRITFFLCSRIRV